MNNNRIIKVFLASSEELKADRNTFGNLIRRLDDIYEERGIRIKLFEWEDCDAAYNNNRKQDEYNDEVKASDMFLALFYKKAGKFTLEEFDVATEEFRRTEIKPKPYVYCRDLPEGEQESEELKEFKKRLFEEMGHYWSTYNNEDSLQLHFVMQLQLVENSRLDKLKVENGEVKLDGTTIARMEHLRFAADNPDYQRMSLRLQELPLLIKEAHHRIENYPDDQNFKDDLQKLLNEKNQLQKDFGQHQQLLFDTAKRIATLQGEAITDRMRRAIDAFERGNVREANIILDEAEKDGDSRFAEFEKKEELREKEICNIHRDIENLFIQTATVMADVELPMQARINKTIELYKKADYRATRTAYDKEKYAELLSSYAKFLYNYGLYKESEAIYLRQISLVKGLHGTESKETATSYNNIGLVYWSQGDYDKALGYHFKALAIWEKVPSVEQPDTATSYNNIGLVYDDQGDYDKALEYHFKALAIREKVPGPEHPDTATSYDSIGLVYDKQGDYDKALEYHFKALAIMEKVLGTDHPDTATTYNNIGTVFRKQSNYDKALEYYFKALEIREKVLGTDHPDTASSYNNIGLLYEKQGDYDKALEYLSKALYIAEKSLGTEHPNTASSYNNIGSVYWDRGEEGDYDKALEYYFKALKIDEKVLGKDHPSTATSYNNIGSLYYAKGDYPKALEYLNKAYRIFEEVLGAEHPNTKKTVEWINLVKEVEERTFFWQRLFGM